MRIARSPARVTLIGDHTDYNDGLSLPMAIDLSTEASFSPRPDTFLIGLDSDQFPEPWEFTLQGATTTTSPPPRPPEARLAAALIARAAPPEGGQVRVRSSVPVGAGLASSAAFSVALLLALGQPLEAEALARMNQAAEDDTGAHVGLLDPLAMVDARAGHATLIDFATLERRLAAIPPEARFVIVHSEASRHLNASPYGTRRAECETAAVLLGQPLGLCEPGDLSALADPVLRRRARHVVSECARVREVAHLLASGDLAGVGQLMAEGHRSLAEDYLVSIPEVDDLVSRLHQMPGVLGARMSGGGFGGCVLALCEPGSPALDPTTHEGRRAWVVSPSDGADVRAAP